MGAESDTPPADRRLATLAGRQYGVVTRGQLRALGIGHNGVGERVRTGRLHRVHRGVYAVGHRVLTQEARWLAATLACGPGAALSHRSAAALWALRPSSAPTVDVSVPTGAGIRARHGIRVHRSARLTADDVTVHCGIPVTTVARTLLDLADALPPQPVKRAIHEADYRGLLDMAALVAVVERNPGRRGPTVLALARGPVERTRSELEERFLALCSKHGLPRPEVAARIEGFEVDFLWRAERIVVEIDGLAAHRTRQAMERDRLRDRRLLLAGYRTVRLTSQSLTRDWEVVFADLRALRAAAHAGTSSARSPESRSRASSKPPSRASTSSARAR